MSKKNNNKNKQTRFEIKDPFAAREAKRYDRPIPSREALLTFLADRGKLTKLHVIAEEIGIEDDRDQTALERRLEAMVRDGQLHRNRRGGFGVARKLDLIAGRLTAKADGFGFLLPDEGGDDIYLSPKQMRVALHGDRLLVAVTGVDRRGRKEGQIVEVLERANHEVVGRYFRESGVGFVAPDERRLHQDVLVPPGKEGKARTGQIVHVKITDQPTTHRQPVGEVVDILGQPGDPGMAVEIAIRTHELPTDFPDDVKSQVGQLPDQVARNDKQGRKDLRGTPLVTIDGSDAKDFDDAVWCERHKNGWRLLVAIADVSHYVAPETPLDEEAKTRGTSAYFPNRVLPMLPEKLSNGLCSLVPDEDRLAMVCDMKVDARGNVKSSTFYRATIRSHARLTYNRMWDIVGNRDSRARKSVDHLLTPLDELFNLFKALKKARARRGSIDFDTTEVEFVISDKGRVKDIVPVERNDAHKLIEECMIAANVQAARFLEKHDLPGPFRIHEPPKEEKVEALRTFLHEIGLTMAGSKKDKISSKDIAKVMEHASGRHDEKLISMVALRSMQMAVYHPENKGHFGLSLDSYAHFTSPIRRYPDLLLHRGIGHILDGGNAGDFRYPPPVMEPLASHCSMTERRAEEASRDVIDRLKCVFMEDHLGDSFDGVISGVTSFGVFVEIPQFGVDGLVHVTSLPNDYYHFDPVHHQMKGERRGETFQLGDKMRVKVAGVDPGERKIDFLPAED